MKLVSTELVIHKTMCGQKFEAGLIEMHIKVYTCQIIYKLLMHFVNGIHKSGQSSLQKYTS